MVFIYGFLYRVVFIYGLLYFILSAAVGKRKYYLHPYEDSVLFLEEGEGMYRPGEKGSATSGVAIPCVVH